MPKDQLPAVVSSSTPAGTADTHIVPALIADAGDPAAWRYVELFTANIRNPNTRRAYARAGTSFFAWRDERGLTLKTIRPHDVATYIETRQGHNASALLEKPMAQADAWRMIRRRAAAPPAAGIAAPIGNHSFRATGITAYLANGGALERAQEMAAHESPRTTKLYDRTKERLAQDEVERIRL